MKIQLKHITINEVDRGGEGEILHGALITHINVSTIGGSAEVTVYYLVGDEKLKTVPVAILRPEDWAK